MALTATLIFSPSSGTGFGSGAWTTGSFTPAARRLLVVAQAMTTSLSAMRGVDLTIDDSDSGITSWASAVATASHPTSWGYGQRVWVSDQAASGGSMTLTFDCGAYAIEQYIVSVYELTDYSGIGAVIDGTDDGTGSASLTLPSAPAASSIVLAGVLNELDGGTTSITPGAGWTEDIDRNRTAWYAAQIQRRSGSTSTSVSWDDLNPGGATPAGADTWAVELLETGGGAPVITVQPTEQTAANGASATFAATATGATSYQWETQAPGGGAWANVSGGSGATTDTYTTGVLSRATDAGRLYRLKATNGSGDTYSNAALLRVTEIPTSYASAVGLVVGSSLSWVGFGYVGAGDSSSGSHSATGALPADSAAISGAAARAALHATSGALGASGATIAGQAAHHHATTGALAASSATLVGAAAHLTLHTTTGALVAQASTVTGSAAHHHATTGALVAQSASIAGSAQHHHATTGALSAQAASITGAANHPHTTTGALVAQAATVSGAADHTTAGATHATTGALTAQDATVTGSATHLTLHTTSGALVAEASTVTGSANHPHTTSGALAAGASSVTGSATHPHTTSGALAADSAAIAGAASHVAVGAHATAGDLFAQAASIAGEAIRTASASAQAAGLGDYAATVIAKRRQAELSRELERQRQAQRAAEEEVEDRERALVRARSEKTRERERERLAKALERQAEQSRLAELIAQQLSAIMQAGARPFPLPAEDHRSRDEDEEDALILLMLA